MLNPKPFVIAVDGPSASGKGTLAKKISQCYNLYYLDTGILYRSIAYDMIKNGYNLKNKKQAIAIAKNLNLKNIIPCKKFRTEEVAKAASIIAKIQEVRESLIENQNYIAYNPPKNKNGSILDGRDIGTIICPKANIKFYIKANIETRALRRMRELKKSSMTDIIRDLKLRDNMDLNRINAPLKCAHDAIIIDSTNLTAEEVFSKASKYIENVLSIHVM